MGQSAGREHLDESRLFLHREAEFAKQHKTDTDEALLAYLIACAKELGRRPNKADVVGYTYIKSRFGPWNRVLERAGLKEKSTRQLKKEQRSQPVEK